MDLKQAEEVIERRENGDMVYEQEYIDALEVVKDHMTKQVSHWNERAMVIDPWESIILSPTDVSEPKYGFRYFKSAELDAEGEKIEIEQLVFYDATTEKRYTRADKDSPFVLKDERKFRNVRWC